MSRKPIKLCPAICTEYHDKQFIAEMFDVSERTVFNWIRDKKLRATTFGLVRCDWIREDLLEPQKEKQIS